MTYEVEGHVQRHGHEEAVPARGARVDGVPRDGAAPSTPSMRRQMSTLINAHDDKREKAKAQILPVPRLEVGPLRRDTTMRINGRFQTRVPQVLVVGSFKTGHPRGRSKRQRELEAEDDDDCRVGNSIKLRELDRRLSHIFC